MIPAESINLEYTEILGRCQAHRGGVKGYDHVCLQAR